MTNAKIPILILAGGKGKRLGKMTKNLPKPLVNIHGKPFVWYLIDRLRKQGFRDITLLTGYKAEKFQDYEWPKGVKFRKDKPGASVTDSIVRARPNKPFWLLNGDTWLEFDLPKNLKTNTLVVCDGKSSGAQFFCNVLPFQVLEPEDMWDYYWDMGTLVGLNNVWDILKGYRCL